MEFDGRLGRAWHACLIALLNQFEGRINSTGVAYMFQGPLARWGGLAIAGSLPVHRHLGISVVEQDFGGSVVCSGADRARPRLRII